mmetsp:Transcript_48570/g.135068  ORF Transcript_48570/g.135068 Transcript_48570/m.135068 type:complete len:317 (+) Transcript_48570:949-1899(+)
MALGHFQDPPYHLEVLIGLRCCPLREAWRCLHRAWRDGGPAHALLRRLCSVGQLAGKPPSRAEGRVSLGTGGFLACLGRLVPHVHLQVPEFLHSMWAERPALRLLKRLVEQARRRGREAGEICPHLREAEIFHILHVIRELLQDLTEDAVPSVHLLAEHLFVGCDLIAQGPLRLVEARVHLVAQSEDLVCDAVKSGEHALLQSAHLAEHLGDVEIKHLLGCHLDLCVEVSNGIEDRLVALPHGVLNAIEVAVDPLEPFHNGVAIGRVVSGELVFVGAHLHVIDELRCIKHHIKDVCADIVQANGKAPPDAEWGNDE